MPLSPITRRQFLRSAGGVTFLALTPIGRGLFAAPDTALPRFTALPYVQPGNASRLVNGAETAVIVWQTEHHSAEFMLDYGPTPAYGKSATVARTERWQGSADADRRYNYAADLSALELSRRYFYRLSGGGHVIAEGHFTTRKKRGERARFVAFGDNAHGDPGQRAVAYYSYRANPDFIMNTGDNVYESGLDSEYAAYFYPIYNADKSDPAVGAPLLRSMPFYTVLANHDVAHKDAQGRPAADFDQNRDSLGYYTAMHLPRNGPTPNPTVLIGSPQWISDFRTCAGGRYPNMANYSFDYGDAHFLCLDSNVYVDPTAPALRAWIEADLKGTDALWKFAVYHHPSFNAGDKHYKEQQMRALSPLFEVQGVDFCLSGHEHTYQRTRPLRFQPKDMTKASPEFVDDRRIPGVFSTDQEFDGKTHRRPEGIIYVTTGAGGKELYDPGFDQAPEKWLHPEDGNEAYVARFISEQHSLTVFDVNGKELVMTQIGERGDVLDTIRVSKA